MTHIRPENLLPFSDGWKRPDVEGIKEALAKAGLTQEQAAEIVGIKEGRTVRRWVGGETPIPYAPWALICDLAGLGQIWKAGRARKQS
jgi:hypothetical protein